jgi:large subunit ribosomal protein L9
MRATEQGHLFGSVGPEQVAQILVESGFDMIRPSSVNMPRHVEEVGDNELEIMLHPEVVVKITLRVAPLEENAGEE